MMSSARRLAAALFALVFAGLLSGCAVGPTRALYTPIGLEDGFGYRSDPSQDTPGALTVTYVTPSMSARKLGNTREEARAGARRLAVDLALRRAAELAQAEGAQRFTLLSREVGVDLTLDRSYIYDGYDPVYGPYRPGYPGYWPGYRSYPYSYSYAWVRATAHIDIVFGDAGTGTVYDSAEVLRSTHRRYATSDLNVFDAPPQ